MLMITRSGNYIKPHWLFDLFMISLFTILFGEWILPLADLTDTHSLPVFQLFFVCVLLLRLLPLPWYVHLLLNVGIILYIVHYLYFGDSFFRWAWLLELGEKLNSSFFLLIKWDLAQLSFEVKTLLFLLSIWYVAAYLYQFRFRRISILTFLVMTIIYLATLDTFTPYQAGSGIVRTLICGFLLLTLLHQVSVRTRTSIALERAEVANTRAAWLFGNKGNSNWLNPAFLVWIIASIFMLSVAAGLGIIAPKAGPKWPDPVGFIQSHSGISLLGEGAAVQKVGYGDHDEVLGGGFVQDNSIAFYAITTERQYWRGESKDIYTGRGWEKSNPGELYYISPQDEPVYLAGHPGSLFEPGVATEQILSKVFFTERRFSNLFYQGDLEQIQIYPKHTYLQLEPISARFTTWEDDIFSARKDIEEYVFESSYPKFSIRLLKEADSSLIPGEVIQRYTQLPEHLPARIGELAEELTASLDNQYDRVKEIESYFRRQGYRYETKDVPVPAPDQDYVDQFIFETKRGYCDNFSTAMVVMLRTIDIPARWVKGFTFGEIIEQNDGNLYTQVLNKNAHSWVEVYFPGVGWVPFEPTQSFVNPYVFERDQEHDEGSTAAEEQERGNRDTPRPREDLLEELNTAEPLSEQANGFSPFQRGHTLKQDIRLFIWIVIFLALLFCALLYWRYPILSWLISRYRKSQNKHSLKSYELLISYLGVLALRRKPSQTLREYILSLEEQLESDWPAFIQQYEHMRYGRKHAGRKENS